MLYRLVAIIGYAIQPRYTIPLRFAKVHSVLFARGNCLMIPFSEGITMHGLKGFTVVNLIALIYYLCFPVLPYRVTWFREVRGII